MLSVASFFTISFCRNVLPIEKSGGNLSFQNKIKENYFTHTSLLANFGTAEGALRQEQTIFVCALQIDGGSVVQRINAKSSILRLFFFNFSSTNCYDETLFAIAAHFSKAYSIAPFPPSYDKAVSSKELIPKYFGHLCKPFMSVLA